MANLPAMGANGKLDDTNMTKGVVYAYESQDINRAARFAVDTGAATVELAVDSTKGYDHFFVYDARNVFTTSKPCVVKFDEGQGDVVMQTAGDSYFFFYAKESALGFRWRFIDLNDPDRRGVV